MSTMNSLSKIRSLKMKHVSTRGLTLQFIKMFSILAKYVISTFAGMLIPSQTICQTNMTQQRLTISNSTCRCTSSTRRPPSTCWMWPTGQIRTPGSAWLKIATWSCQAEWNLCCTFEGHMTWQLWNTFESTKIVLQPKCNTRVRWVKKSIINIVYLDLV